MIHAPWSAEDVAALNRRQAEGFYRITCVNSEHGNLIAYPDGWHCEQCNHRQNWAPRFMLPAQNSSGHASGIRLEWSPKDVPWLKKD
jgi:hypothetical protein